MQRILAFPCVRLALEETRRRRSVFCDFEADDRVRLLCTETEAKKLARGASSSRARWATLARLSAGWTAFVSCYSPYRYPFLDSTIVGVNGMCSEIAQNFSFDR
jgi:hypothetical protein